MKRCKYCFQEINNDASKCNECGEFQTFYGRFLRYLPAFSLLIALASFGFGIWQLQEKKVVTVEKNYAITEKTIAVAEKDSAVAVQKELEKKFEQEKNKKEELAQDLIVQITNEALNTSTLRTMNNREFIDLKNSAENNPNNKRLQNEYLLHKSIRYLKDNGNRQEP